MDLALPKFVPVTSHPLAVGGFSVSFPADGGGTGRVSLAGPRVGDVGADLKQSDGTPVFRRNHPLLTSTAIRDAARALDRAVSRVLDGSGGASDAAAGEASIGTLLAYQGAPWDSRDATWIQLRSGDARSEAVRDAARVVNELIRAAG